MRKIQRSIASAVIISKEGMLLLGRKDPNAGGVYPDAWHLPGGGVESGESLEQAMRREVSQEVVGLDFSDALIKHIPIIGSGESQKTLQTGEKVWCEMQFNRFEIRLTESVEVLTSKLHPGDDLVELRWFDRKTLQDVQLIPGGKEFFVQAGYMDA